MNQIHTLLCGMLIGATALSGSALAEGSAPSPLGDTVTTRFGELQFTQPFADGYPTRATVEKLYGELDFQRATQAYLWSLPLVGFAQWQHEHRSVFGARNGDVVSYRSFDDKMGLITANATTPYLIAFADLGENGPLVVEVPAQGLTGGVLDYWQRPVDLPSGGLIGKFLLIGPEQADPKDPSLTTIRATTNNVFIGFRALGTNENEINAALDALMIYPYAERGAPKAARIILPAGRKWSGTQPRGLEYWQRVQEAIDSEPVAERDRLFMGMLKSIGIEKGKPFDPTPEQKKVLEEAVIAGEAMAKANTFDKRIADPFWPGSHWKLAMHLEPSQQVENYDQLDERAAWFYEAVTASEDMTGRHPGVGSTYLGAYKDSKGEWLDGGNFYRLHVPANAPAKNFWSITAYDVNTRCFIDTPWKIADRSSRQDLTKNADGSVDLYIGPKPPSDTAKHKNWIPTVPGKAWFTYLRLYGPLQGYYDKSWVLPDIEVTNAWE